MMSKAVATCVKLYLYISLIYRTLFDWALGLSQRVSNCIFISHNVCTCREKLLLDP